MQDVVKERFLKPQTKEIICSQRKWKKQASNQIARAMEKQAKIQIKCW